MLPQVNVRILAADNSGPLAGARVVVQLNHADTSEGFGYVLPEPIEGVCDADGVLTVALWPNELGTTNSKYIVEVENAATGAMLRVSAFIPNRDCDLHTVADPLASPDAIIGTIVPYVGTVNGPTGIKKVNVTCYAADQNGQPVKGGTVTAILNRIDVDPTVGYIMPEEIVGTTNDAGVCVLQLWPNQLGSTQSQYTFLIENPDTEQVIKLIATIPDANCNLHLVANLPAYPGKSDGQLAVDQVLELVAPVQANADQVAADRVVVAQAAAEAIAAITTVVNSTDAAVAAAGVATAKASQANTSQQAALASEIAAETAESNAIGARDVAVAAKDVAVTKAGEASTSATAADGSKTAAQTAKTAAETAKGLAEAANTAAQTAKTAAETAQTGAQTAKTAAEGARDAALGYRDTAKTHRDDALGFKTAAETAAGTATTKAGEAAGSATTANTKAGEAATSATNAATSKTGADTAKTAAETAKTAAETARTAAQTAETNAKASETEAKTSETNAKTSETNAATSAGTAATKASDATTAAGTATNAATTATTRAGEAATSSVTALTKAGEAATSATNAETAKVAAETARDAAVAAKTAAETAKTGAETAKTGSETARDAAVTAKNGAEAAIALSQAWASQGAGTVNGTIYYSSLKYALDAKAQADRAQGYADGMAAGQVNADWNATSGAAQILNKPVVPSKTSELTNDANFVTVAAARNAISATGTGISYDPATGVFTGTAQPLTATAITDALGYTPWHAGNDGSGSGLDADRLRNMTPSSAANGTTIAQRDANGYLYAVRFSWSATATARNTDTIFYSSTDSFIQKNTKTGFLTSLGLEQVENKTSATIRGELTSANVTTALGFTPAKWSVSNYATGTNLNVPALSGNISFDGQDMTNAPALGWFNYLTTLHRGGNAINYTFAFKHGAAGLIETFVGTANDVLASEGTRTWSWYKLWNSSNDGAGSGLDADLLDGMQPSTGTTASTIAQRDANGYLYAVHFSTSAGISTRTTDTVFYSSTNDFIYKNTAAGFKASLGLGNVDNTSDANKPISTATQAALDLKATIVYVDNKVAALVNGSAASLDTLNELATALGNDANFATTMSNSLGKRVRVDAAQAFTAPEIAQAKANIALGNVDNTSDANKPVSTAQQAALDAKQALSGKDAASGYAGLAADYSITLKKTDGTNASKLTSIATAARTWTFPDKDGTVAMMSDLSAISAVPLMSRVARSSNTQIVKADAGKLFAMTGTFTQTFVANATLADGWFCYIHNAGTGEITIPASDGRTNWKMYPGEVRKFYCDGTTLRSFVMNSFFLQSQVSGTFIPPPGYQSFKIRAIGAGSGGWGGGGGASGGSWYENYYDDEYGGYVETFPIGGSGGHGGGSGASGSVSEIEVSASELPVSGVSYTIGVGGTGGAGGAGGPSCPKGSSQYGNSGYAGGKGLSGANTVFGTNNTSARYYITGAGATSTTHSTGGGGGDSYNSSVYSSSYNNYMGGIGQAGYGGVAGYNSKAVLILNGNGGVFGSMGTFTNYAEWNGSGGYGANGTPMPLSLSYPTPTGSTAKPAKGTAGAGGAGGQGGAGSASNRNTAATAVGGAGGPGGDGGDGMVEIKGYF